MARRTLPFAFILRKQSKNESTKGIFGLEIDRKTNILSLAAFVLSSAGVAGQIYFFFQGPKVALQPPEQTVFYNLLSADGKTNYLQIASRMAYVNTGQPGFNDAIRKESATLQIGSKTFNFFWQKYVYTDADGAKFIVNPKGDALPVAINAGAVEAHETSFSPIPKQGSQVSYGANYLKFEEFTKLAVAEEKLIVTLNYETFSGSLGNATCTIIIDTAFRYYIRNGWIAPLCITE
jgi:hypothetical protein